MTIETILCRPPPPVERGCGANSPVQRLRMTDGSIWTSDVAAGTSDGLRDWRTEAFVASSVDAGESAQRMALLLQETLPKKLHDSLDGDSATTWTVSRVPDWRYSMTVLGVLAEGLFTTQTGHLAAAIDFRQAVLGGPVVATRSRPCQPPHELQR